MAEVGDADADADVAADADADVAAADDAGTGVWVRAAPSGVPAKRWPRIHYSYSVLAGGGVANSTNLLS